MCVYLEKYLKGNTRLEKPLRTSMAVYTAALASP
jgi:hypothetical protein